ncbi:PREDICTED: uncharacterized protein LOC109465954 [Branchiostoma belcheri]|uniref:Uncharacterized protein LOC109465954 n=1 Tax=Branchiostoma belcheri TaxID=7741 RepID=A0A6P4Y3J8_BRABE|nr:PREDICTED: uncharacterized protein LOC109465954 [Branchiostoma belcheri]
MSKRRGRCNRRSRRRAKMTFPVEPGQEELTGLPSLRMWAAMAGVFLFGVALVIGLSVTESTHVEAQTAVDVRLDGSWAHYQGEFADPTAVDEAPLDDQTPIQSDGDDSDWYLTTLDQKYQVPVRDRVPGRSRDVDVPGDGGVKWSSNELMSTHYAHTPQHVIGLSAAPTHVDTQATVDVRLDGSWAHYQGQFADPTAVDNAPVDDEAHTIQSDGNDSDWYLTTLDELYRVPVRARVPGRSREVGDGVPDMDDNQDAPGVSAALPDGDLDGDDDWEKKYSDEHLNSGDEKRPTSAMTSGYNSSTGMSARDDSSLLDGNDVDPVRDEEEGTSVVDAMTLENTNSTVLAKNPQNHDKNHHVRKNPVKNADKMTVIVMVGTVVTFSVVHRHQCMTQMPRWV